MQSVLRAVIQCQRSPQAWREASQPPDDGPLDLSGRLALELRQQQQPALPFGKTIEHGRALLRLHRIALPVTIITPGVCRFRPGFNRYPVGNLRLANLPANALELAFSVGAPEQLD